LYRAKYKNYAGNSYTYYVFKQLIKLFLTEVYLFKYQGHIFTHRELLNYSISQLFKQSDPSKIKSITELIESGEVVKVKYQCIKVCEPLDINFHPISKLNICLIDVNKTGNFINSYDSLIVKPFGLF
jgi:hypothetical protein